MVNVIRIIVVAMLVFMVLSGQAMAQGEAVGSGTGTKETGTGATGAAAKSAESPVTSPRVAEEKNPIASKTAAPIRGPNTGAMGRAYTDGWSGLGGGFIGDFGPQYNTYPCGFSMENWNMYGPLGMYGQYGMYGPTGMYGPAGPSFGSSLGFGGFGAGDPWRIYKAYNIAEVEKAAGKEKAQAKAAGSVAK